MIAETSLAQYARQWGAAEVPFAEKSLAKLFHSPQSDKSIKLLNQCAALRSLMLLSGPNGIGKSTTTAHWRAALHPKQFLPIVITQASLSGSAILSVLMHKLGKPPRMRRSDNLANLEEALDELGSVVPVLILDDAQQYSLDSLEEIRLLLGLNLPSQPAFALILIGDDWFLKSLRLRSHRALFSRIAIHHKLSPLKCEQTNAYLEHQLKQVGIHRNCFEEAAVDLIYAASQGIHRTINLLAREAWIQASENNQTLITSQHIQNAIEKVPVAEPVISEQVPVA